MATPERSLPHNFLAGPTSELIPVPQAATVDRLRYQLLNRLKGIVQNATEIFTPTEALPVLGQTLKNPVTEAAEAVVNRRWGTEELARMGSVGSEGTELSQRYKDEVKRLIQKSRSDIERSMSPQELTDLRQEEQHYEERLKIRMKQRTLNIPWPQRGDVMQNYEASLIARIERCHRTND